jgi:hypothetical protein
MSLAAIELLIARIAEHRFGVFTRADALACGMPLRSIDSRLKSGRWKALHPGVYVVAGTPDHLASSIGSSCLWAGTGSAASHSAAAAHWGLAGLGEGPVEISTYRYLRSDDVIVHTRCRLQRRDARMREGIAVTSVERTLIDLMAVCSVEQVEIALDDALTRRLTPSSASSRGSETCRRT